MRRFPSLQTLRAELTLCAIGRHSATANLDTNLLRAVALSVVIYAQYCARRDRYEESRIAGKTGQLVFAVRGR